MSNPLNLDQLRADMIRVFICDCIALAGATTPGLVLYFLGGM